MQISPQGEKYKAVSVSAALNQSREIKTFEDMSFLRTQVAV
jgi:hypothetical protein